MTSVEPETVNDLMRMSYGMAGKAIRRIGPRLSGMDADDLAQEAMLGLLKRGPRHNPQLGSKTTYYWMVIRSSISDALRREPHCRRGIPINFAALSPYVPAKNQFPDAHARVDCARLLSSLTDREREVVEAYMAEIPQSVLAQRYGVHPSRISQIRKSAMLKLKDTAGAGA